MKDGVWQRKANDMRDGQEAFQHGFCNEGQCGAGGTVLAIMQVFSSFL